MPGPIFIERSGLRGFGTSDAASSPGRTEITQEQWTRQVNTQWEAANSGVIPQLRRRIGYLGMGGIAALLGAAVVGGLGKPALATPLAVLGVAGVAIGTFTATKSEQTAEAAMAGWRGW